MSNFHKNLVETYTRELYNLEDANREISKATVSVNTEDLAFLDAFSTNFEKSRSELICELLAHATTELFQSLPSSKQLHISVLADTNYKNALAKAGYDIDDFVQSRWSTMAEMRAKQDA